MSDRAGDGPSPAPAGSLARRLLSSGAWVLFGKVLTIASALAITKLLAQLMDKPSVAGYELAFRVVALGGMVAQFGLHQAVVRYVAESMGTGRPGRARAAIRSVYRVALPASLAFALVLALGGLDRVAPLFNVTTLVGLGGLVAIWLFSHTAQVINSETFRGFKDLRLATLFGGVISGLLVVAGLATLWWRSGSATLEQALTVVAAGFGLSVLAGTGAVALRWRSLPRPAAGDRVDGIYRMGAAMWLTGLMGWALGQSDLFLIARFSGDSAAADYGVAARIVNLVGTSLVLVNLVVPPFIAELYARGERERLQRILRAAATLAGIPALLVLILFVVGGAPVLGLVASADYRTAAPILAILAVGRLAAVVTGSCGFALAMTGHSRVLARVTVVSALVTMAGGLWAATRYGAIGVACAYSLGFVLQNVWCLFEARRHTGLWTLMGIPRVADIRAILRR